MVAGLRTGVAEREGSTEIICRYVKSKIIVDFTIFESYNDDDMQSHTCSASEENTGFATAPPHSDMHVVDLPPGASASFYTV
jgi:hypothetical protein